jgi:hypothetical protein
MLWIDTKTDDDARRCSEAHWSPVWVNGESSSSASVAGPKNVDDQFWTDAIKEVHDNPAARFAMAKQQLPLPAAFREMAIALRAIIRRLRRDERPFNEELHQLHYWAALSSWSLPYSEALGEPGYNVFESTPYAKLAELDLSYHVIGSEELVGLNGTDRKMMRDAWGAPKTHTTAHAVYGDLWREQERKLAEVRTRHRNAFIDKNTTLARSEQLALIAPDVSPPRSFLARIFGR